MLATWRFIRIVDHAILLPHHRLLFQHGDLPSREVIGIELGHEAARAGDGDLTAEERTEVHSGSGRHIGLQPPAWLTNAKCGVPGRSDTIEVSLPAPSKRASGWRAAPPALTLVWR